MSFGSTSNRPRLAWIDFAKGLSTALIVLYHNSLLMGRIAPDTPMVWSVVSDALSPIRMPVFFLISGFLSAKLLQRPLRDNFQRTFGLFALSVLWTSIFLSRLLVPAARDGFSAPSFDSIVAALLLPTSFWYIWTLPVLHLIAWISWQFARERSRLIIVPLLVLSFFGPLIEHHTLPIIPEPLDALKAGSIAMNAVWYFVGLHFKDQWSALIARASVTRLCVSGLLYLAVVTPLLALGDDTILVMRTPLAAIALVFAASGLGLMKFTSGFARLMAWVGQRTLPVYIFHLFGLAIISGLVKLSGFTATVSANALLVDLIASPIVCLVLVVTTRFAGDVFDRIGLRALIHPMALSPRPRLREATSG